MRAITFEASAVELKSVKPMLLFYILTVISSSSCDSESA